ncbi:MAG: RluA family pseudouridine synthase, partial [Clostridiales bacterium]|nr:RluA family pseudouridine synthase [Clostridiales bacterium]
MRKFDFIITPNYDNAAIKTVLRNHFGMSERLVIKLKETSGILLNGVPEFVIKTVRTNDVMTVIIPDEASENIVPNNIPLEILYEDEDILVVNKPAGMPTHPSVRHYEGT